MVPDLISIIYLLIASSKSGKQTPGWKWGLHLGLNLSDSFHRIWVIASIVKCGMKLIWEFNPAVCDRCTCLSMMGLMLIHVSKRGLWPFARIFVWLMPCTEHHGGCARLQYTPRIMLTACAYGVVWSVLSNEATVRNIIWINNLTEHQRGALRTIGITWYNHLRKKAACILGGIYCF